MQADTLCSCAAGMGSDVPLIMCAMPLGEQLQHRQLYVEALMNTRRKLAIDDLDRLSGGGAEKIVQESHIWALTAMAGQIFTENLNDEDAVLFSCRKSF